MSSGMSTGNQRQRRKTSRTPKQDKSAGVSPFVGPATGGGRYRPVTRKRLVCCYGNEIIYIHETYVSVSHPRAEQENRGSRY